MEKRAPGLRAVALVTLVFIILSLLATWPLALHLDDSFLGSFKANDMRFNLWVIFWGYHSLFNDPLNLHHANIYHPEPYTFAYSDIELSHSVLMAPVIALSYNPALVYNLLVIISLVLGGVGWYLLLHRFTGYHSAAFGGAALIQFCAGRFGRYSQIQFFGDHWLPWTLLALWLWLAGSNTGRRWLWATLAGLGFSLHALSGSHHAVFGIIIVGASGLYLTLRNGLYRRPVFYGQLALALGLILLLLVPVFYPYFIVGEAMAEHRVGGDFQLREGSAGPVEWFRSGSRFYRWLEEATGWPGAVLNDRAKGSLWPGVVPIVLLVIALFHSGRPRSGDGGTPFWSRALDAVTLAAVATLALALLLPGDQLFSPDDFLASPLAWLGGAGILAAVLRLLLPGGGKHLLILVWDWLRHNLVISADKMLWLGLLLFSIWASLGPEGLLYKLLADLPAVSLIRVPRRFFLIGIVALGVLAAFAFAQLLRRSRSRTRYFIIYALLLIGFAAESAYAPLRLYPVREVPEVYEWYGEQPGDFTVFEYPVNEVGYPEFIRQVYGSIHHWKTLIVGYSGFQSEANKALLRELNQTVPTAEGLQRLEELNTRYLAVFTDRIAEMKQEQFSRAAEEGHLKRVKSWGSLVVYELTSWSAQP